MEHAQPERTDNEQSDCEMQPAPLKPNHSQRKAPPQVMAPTSATFRTGTFRIEPKYQIPKRIKGLQRCQTRAAAPNKRNANLMRCPTRALTQEPPPAPVQVSIRTNRPGRTQDNSMAYARV